VHVLQAPLGRNALGRVESGTRVRDKADPGEDLIRFDNDLVGSVDPLYARRSISEGRVDTILPQIGRFEHMRVGRKNQGQHRHLLSHPIADSTFGDRLVVVNAGGEQCSPRTDDTVGSGLDRLSHRYACVPEGRGAQAGGPILQGLAERSYRI
jgi:hypothetical protein